MLQMNLIRQEELWKELHWELRREVDRGLYWELRWDLDGEVYRPLGLQILTDLSQFKISRV
jgi:hypothetical protein